MPDCDECWRWSVDCAVCCTQITHSLPRWTIPAVLIANSFSLLFYNVAGMFVTEVRFPEPDHHLNALVLWLRYKVLHKSIILGHQVHRSLTELDALVHSKLLELLDVCHAHTQQMCAVYLSAKLPFDCVSCFLYTAQCAICTRP